MATHDNHQEDHTVCYQVGLFFIAVLAVIILLAILH